ncbi:hypothetical protein B0H17DRAFT_1162245 [Mycena rosella]|uniref:NADH:flavin oxidoreductase/NADH oxidase N-terminal domain-containing protein n=1 Tax=Mycena rosella TaxID=1033263 RepID=A0AAD7CY97_MYCRO|nr:hypothetical protein B0H17DRAFT_1162245 [Mycena rosella]
MTGRHGRAHSNRSTDSVPNEVMLEYYVQRAGTLITRYGMEVDNVPGIYNKEQVAGWKKITDPMHEAGSKMYCQVPSRTSHPDAPQQIKAGEICTSNITYTFQPIEVPDSSVIVEQFKAAATNAKDAGFDGVELHGTNGFLVEQFLDSMANQRTEKWGGSPKNHARFVLEVLKAFIEVWGPNVALKISPSSGPNDVGMPLPETIETFGYLLREVDKLGLAYVTLMRYSAINAGKKRDTPHDVLAEELVDGVVVSGLFIGLSRITHPDLGKHIQAGKPLDNIPDFAHLYGADGVDPALGYLDYKAAVY